MGNCRFSDDAAAGRVSGDWAACRAAADSESLKTSLIEAKTTENPEPENNKKKRRETLLIQYDLNSS